MAWAAVAAGAASVIGGAISSNSAKKAANTQSDAAKQAAATYQQGVQPYIDAGKTGINNMAASVAPGGLATQRFSMADATNSPAEQHALQQGEQAIQNSAAAKGGLINSNVMQGLTEFGQKNAALYQGQAFDQWKQQQQMELGANQNLANVGVNAATGNATTQANAVNAAGGAQAGGQIGQGNAMTNTMGQLGDILGQSDLFKPAIATVPPVSMGSDPNGYQGTQNNPSAFVPSDERLKEDISHVGMTHDGLPIYTFRMRGSGGPKQMGVMAQDVEKMQPQAAARGSHGYRMVDYGKVR
jgi:hypothetical protein